MLSKYRLQILSLIIGAIAGFLLFHPYAMLISSTMHAHQNEGTHLHLKGLFSNLLTSFQPIMLPMAVAFALFGGIIGLLIGIVVDRKKKLYAVELQNEKKKVALETLKTLMITLSHYLLNANVIIGGRARHCRVLESKKDTLNSLEAIEEQAKKIDAVIGALRKATEIKTIHYASEGHDLLLDITREIEEGLHKEKGE